MKVLDIVTYPDKRLKTKSELVKKIDEKIINLVDDMIDTMNANSGLGLAAVQVGEPLKLFIIDWHQRETGKQDKAKVLVFINPEITELSEETVMQDEGCLSLPGIRADIKRFNKCTIKALNIKGKEFVVDAEDLLAIALQHENDHLEGRLYIDRLSKLKKNILIKKYLKLRREGKEK